MSDLKVEGKVADFCPKCKNCKSTTRECDGEKDWLTEVECEDPYDGMIRTLAADSDICCSMFTPKPDRACAKCERFDGTITISYKALFGEPVNCPSYEEKEEPCETKTSRETELEARITELIKASRRKDELIRDYHEKLKKLNDEINLLNSKIDKLGEYYRTDEKLIDSIQKVIFPQEEGSDYTYSYDEILSKVKELKVQSDENGTMYEDLKYWKERSHKAETEVTTLNSKIEVLENLKKENANLTKMVGRLERRVEKRGRWIDDLKGDIDTLQNEFLAISEIAKRAYDESNREIKEETDDE